MSAPSRLGRYEVKRLLGEGEMGTVYLALDPEIGRLVAIKSFRAHTDDGSADLRESRERFEREIRITGTFDHPNIVTLHDVGVAGGRRFVAMEYVDGCSLSEVLAREGSLHPSHVLGLTRQVASALDYAHARGIVHRDVKPANILLNSEGIPKITDFGVAHLVGSTLTREGTAYGSPAYMSPEQAAGQPVTGASDQFSLAVIVYQMLAGERPFAGDSVTSVLFRILHEDPAPPEVLNPLVPKEIGAVVMTALAKNPAERYVDCGTFSGALQAAAGGAAESTGVGSTPATAPAGSRETDEPDPPLHPSPGSSPAPAGPSSAAAGRSAAGSAATDGLQATVRQTVSSTTAWVRGRPRMTLGIALATLLLSTYWLLGTEATRGSTAGDPGRAGSEATTGTAGDPRQPGGSTENEGSVGGRDLQGTGRPGHLPEKLAERTANAAAILDEGLTDAERSIPDWLLTRARCVAVIPGVKKVGFGFGGRYGRGLASCRTGGGWSRPSFVGIKGGSFGLQIGGQSTDLLLVFTNDRAAERLLETKFTLGGDASVAAGPVGRAGELGTDVKLQTEIYSYSRNRGLFAGVSLEGATLSADTEANAEAYGQGVTVGDLLLGRGGPLPPQLASFLRSLERHAP